MKAIAILAFVLSLSQCSQSSEDSQPTDDDTPVGTNEVDFWLTKGNQSVKLQKQNGL